MKKLSQSEILKLVDRWCFYSRGLNRANQSALFFRILATLCKNQLLHRLQTSLLHYSGQVILLILCPNGWSSIQTHVHNLGTFYLRQPYIEMLCFQLVCCNLDTKRRDNKVSKLDSPTNYLTYSSFRYPVGIKCSRKNMQKGFGEQKTDDLKSHNGHFLNIKLFSLKIRFVELRSSACLPCITKSKTLGTRVQQVVAKIIYQFILVRLVHLALIGTPQAPLKRKGILQKQYLVKWQFTQVIEKQKFCQHQHGRCGSSSPSAIIIHGALMQEEGYVGCC